MKPETGSVPHPASTGEGCPVLPDAPPDRLYRTLTSIGQWPEQRIHKRIVGKECDPSFWIHCGHIRQTVRMGKAASCGAQT